MWLLERPYSVRGRCPALELLLLSVVLALGASGSSASVVDETGANTSSRSSAPTAVGDRSADIEQQQLGQQIYLEGVGSSEITAVLAGNLEVPGAVLTCGSCHGTQGIGQPEGGLSPSDLRPFMLQRPYEVASPSGRRHGPYDRRALIRAITMGIDPAGNSLHSAMPRYRMSREDMEALLRHLEGLGETSEAGIDDASIRIGVPLPSPGGSTAEQAETALIDAYLSQVEASGGIFGRRLERVPISWTPESRATAGPNALGLDQADVLALIGGPAEAYEALSTAAEALDLPWIAPRTFATHGRAPGSKIFFLEPGLLEQASALVDGASERWPGSAAALVLPASPPALMSAAAEAVEARWTAKGGSELRRFELGAESSLPMAFDTSEGPVFLMVPGVRGRTAFEGLDGVSVLVPGSLVGGWPPGEPKGTATLYTTTLPARIPLRSRQSAIERWKALTESERLVATPSISDLRTLIALEALVEGLYRAGGEPSRESLVRAIETFRDFETPWGPPISFGPNRRIGFDLPRVARIKPGQG